MTPPGTTRSHRWDPCRTPRAMIEEAKQQESTRSGRRRPRMTEGSRMYHSPRRHSPKFHDERDILGRDPHHSWEAAARAFAVALRGCFAPMPFRAGLTAGVKGTLD